MKQIKLVAKRPKQHRYPAYGKLSAIALNILNRQFNPEKANTYWSCNITYIRTSQGWLYLAIVMDLYSRKVICWVFSDKPNSELTARALRLAVNKRNPNQVVVFSLRSKRSIHQRRLSKLYVHIPVMVNTRASVCIEQQSLYRNL
jgi:putative transposase